MIGRPAAAALAMILASPASHAWESSAKWAGHVVGYRVNPTNNDVKSADALAAVRLGADAWTKQTKAAFRFRFDGTSTATTQGLDGKNLVLFRNQAGSSNTVRASTYTWKLLGTILETDIVFWDKTMSFVTGSMPCNNQIYIENTGIHEFGHALGLDHTDVSTATMWGHSKVCSKSRLKLDPDDIAGVEALYPCSSSSQCDDDDPCTKDTCDSKKKCQRKAIAGCCATSADCDDGDPCTKDTCSGATCKNTPISGCCTKNADCDDGDPCTKDTCSGATCKNTPISGCTSSDTGGSGVPDTGAPDPDAGAAGPDEGAPGPDAGTSSPDTSGSDGAPGGSADASSSGSSGGCTVGSGRGGCPGSALLLLCLGLCWRRRSRSVYRGDAEE